MRVGVEEPGAEVRLTFDTACVSCGVAPWPDSDERLLVFRPGKPLDRSGAVEDLPARLAAAYARVDQLLRRIEGLDHDLEAVRRELTRAEESGRLRQGEVVAGLRGELSRLEGELAAARARQLRDEEATHGLVEPGKRAIEID